MIYKILDQFIDNNAYKIASTPFNDSFRKYSSAEDIVPMANEDFINVISQQDNLQYIGYSKNLPECIFIPTGGYIQNLTKDLIYFLTIVDSKLNKIKIKSPYNETLETDNLSLFTRDPFINRNNLNIYLPNNPIDSKQLATTDWNKVINMSEDELNEMKANADNNKTNIKITLFNINNYLDAPHKESEWEPFINLLRNY